MTKPFLFQRNENYKNNKKIDYLWLLIRRQLVPSSVIYKNQMIEKRSFVLTVLDQLKDGLFASAH